MRKVSMMDHRFFVWFRPVVMVLPILVLSGVAVFFFGCGKDSVTTGNVSFDAGIDDSGISDAGDTMDDKEDAEADGGVADTGTPVVDGGDPDADVAAHVLYDIMADQVVLPFPSNYHLSADGLGVHVGGTHFSNELLGLIQIDQAVREMLQTSRGFATYSPIGLLLSDAPDLQTLPSSGEESLDENSSIVLLEESENGGHYSKVPVRTEYRIYETSRITRHLLLVTPLRTLLPSTTYLLVINDQLLDVEGRPFGRSPGFSFLVGEEAAPESTSPERQTLLLRERQRIGNHLGQMAHPKGVIALVDFTTGDGVPEMRSIMDRFLANEEAPSEPPRVEYRLQSAEDDQIGVFWDGTFPDCHAGPEIMSYGVKGVFSPVNLVGPEGVFQTVEGETGEEFQEFAREDLYFWLMVPAADDTGAVPTDGQRFPVVIVQHGIDHHQNQMCGLSLELLKAGMAVLRFDWPHHGHRGAGGLQFLSLHDLKPIKDNFRQASVELASVVLLLDRLVESGDLDLLPRDNPDGISDLDPSRLAYLGFSMGGIIGALYAPFSDRIQTMVLPFSGVGLFHVMDAFLRDFMPPGAFDAVGATLLAQQLVWVADGVTYAHHIFNTPLEGLPTIKRNILIQQTVGDNRVANTSTEVLVRNAGIPLIERSLLPMEGVPVVPAQGATSGLWQVEGVDHNDYPIDPDNPQVTQLWNQAVHYLHTYFTTGTPEIITQ